MNKVDSSFCLKWAKKIICINKLGGKCQNCGNENIFVLEFHHKDKDKKDFCISQIKHARMNFLLKEVEKCVVLCSNCHTFLHSNEEVKYQTRRDIKKVLLEYKKINLCEICGYSHNSGLVFHHDGKEEKNGIISEISWRYKCSLKSADFVIEELEDELNKCEVICGNCHLIKHSNVVKFETFKEQIMKKVDFYKERPPSYVDDVKRMFLDGIKQVEISRTLGCRKSTVSEIVKRYKLKEN